MVNHHPPSIPTIQLPDLVSHCHFPLRYHKNGDAIAAASDQWFESGCRELTQERRKELHGIKGGKLTAYCYPVCDDHHLRVVSDFLNFLFHLDDISDGMMTKDTEILADAVMNAHWFPNAYLPTHSKGKVQPKDEIDAGKMARDYWSRCLQDAGPGFQARFRESFGLFFDAVNQQAKDRNNGVIPDLESYMITRRDTSGCKPAFDIIEYSLRIDLPDVVVADPVIKALKQGANDLVAWSNDIFSYNVEQVRGDTHNMISILMKDKGLDLQSAVDYAGELCRKTIDTFCEDKKKIPSWGSEVDKDVAGYVRGLEDWIVGSLHWSFITERYFGKKGAEVKESRLVRIFPKRVQSSNAA